MVVPVERLKALQNAAHSRRCAALATAIREGHLDDDEALDFTPTLILHDEDMVRLFGSSAWVVCTKGVCCV